MDQAAGNGALRGVIHLWGLPGSDAVQQALQLAYGSALFLTQALLRRSAAVPRLWLVTQGAQALPGDTANPVQPAQTTCGDLPDLGFEHPDAAPIIIDIYPAAAEPESAILAELTANDGEDQVAWRDEVRYMARTRRRQPDSEALDIPSDQPYELFTPQQGIRATFRPSQSTTVARIGEVAIAVRAIGLNFRDVLNALACIRD